MAQPKSEVTTAKQNQAIEEDYSLLQDQTGSAESILRDTSWPKQDDSLVTTEEQTRPTFSKDNLDTNQIFGSHYALATAYARVTKKLADAEQKNQALQMQDSLRSQDSFRTGKMSGTLGSQTNLAIPFDIEASVNQAWEAYNEKCKECQHLRDELEQVKQQNQSTDHFSRIQNLQEDVLREKAKQDDVVRKLEKTKMEADHFGKKEILAREELEKEREYQRSLIQSAEKKHREMEQKIDELEKSLSTEKGLNTDLVKRERDRQKVMAEEFSIKEESYVGKVRRLEEHVISLKEEVSVLLSMQSSSYNGPMSSNLHANGPVEQMPNHINSPGSESSDAAVLCSNMQSLRGELNDLKTRAAEQASILSAVFQNPKIISLLRSIDKMQGNKSEFPANQTPSVSGDGLVNTPVQCSEESMLKRKKANGPKSRNAFLSQKASANNHNVRQVIGSSLPSVAPDLYGACEQTQNPQSPSSPQRKGSSTDNTVVLKPTEDFIRGLSKDANPEWRRMATKNESIEYNPLLPPLTVSRVIHVSKSPHDFTIAGPTSPPYVVQSNNYNNNFNPGLQTQRYPGMETSTSASGYNGSISSYARPISNGQTSYSMQGYNRDTKDDPFTPAVSSASLSSEDTLVMSTGRQAWPPRSTNPFYQDMKLNENTNVPTNIVTAAARLVEPAAVAKPPDILQNPDRRASATVPRNIMDMDIDPTYATPPNRYQSSDEDNDSDIFEPPAINAPTQHQPKEFVVPKVVHASTLGPLSQNKKAFQDSRYTAAASTTQPNLRPSMRARPDQPSLTTASASRGKRPDNRANSAGVAAAHEYPMDIGKSSRTSDAIRNCPVCALTFSASSSEDSINRHINGHFSDEEDDLLSFDE